MQLPSENPVTEHHGKSLSLLRLLDADVLVDPYAFYRDLRERAPIHWDPYMHLWVVTSYSEVLTVLTNYSADRAPEADYLDRLGLSLLKPFAQMMRQQMLFMDDPMHARLRDRCAIAFTPRKVEELRGIIESVANELLDEVIASGRLDIVADFATPLPAIITTRLIGVPVEDRRQLGVWVQDIIEVHGNFQHHPNRVAEIVRSLEDLKKYVGDHMKKLREHPNGGLIYSLMTAEIDGQRLTDEEVIATTIVTIVGGHETTTNLIANGFLTLLRNPDALEQLRGHPEIVNSALEELLRYESPVQHTARIAPAETELGGKSIRKGAKVVAVLAAANRDPNRFIDPDRLDLLRSDNRHLAFGWGAHFCFGAHLARLEGQIAFNALLLRLPKPALLDITANWRRNAGLRGLTALNITFEPASRRRA